jgi:multiple sugar transport system substrate-binding protein/sn-glycerol 3-phosphate transport system substrate-binding protein
MEMQTLKRIGIVILGIFVSIFFSACSVSNQILPTPSKPAAIIEQTEPPPSAEVLEPTQVQPAVSDDQYQNIDPSGQVVPFWHAYTAEDEAVLQEIVADFNATNPWNIQVSAEYQGDYEDIFNKMLTFMKTADAPGLVVATQNQAATYQLGKGLIDIDELVYSEKWGLSKEEIDDFFPAPFDQDIFPIFENIRLGFPTQRAMDVLYYNQDWLTELGYDGSPTTPGEFKEMSCAAAAQPFSGATAEGNIGYQLSIDASRFASWVFAFGGNLFDGNTAQYRFDNPEAVEAMAFIQGLIKDGCASLVTEPNADRLGFSQGTTLFTSGSSSSLNFYQNAVQAGSNHNWSVAPIPHITPEPIMNIYGASISIPKTNPETQLAAWLFLKYLTSPESQAKWVVNSGYLPVRASVAGYLSEYFAANPAFVVAFEMLPFGRSEPAVAGYDEVGDMVAESMFAISQGADVASVLSDLNTDANTSLQEQLAAVPDTPDPWADIDPSGQTITFWHQQPPARHAALDELIWKFNSTNQWGITVLSEYHDDIKDQMQRLSNASGAANLVEIFQSQAADLQQNGVFNDMTSLVASIKWGLSPQEQEDFYSGIYFQDIYPTFQNARLGFPSHRSMIVLYFNADWLAELKAAGVIDFDGPPQNPAQFKAAACAAAENPYSRSQAEKSVGYQISIDASSFASWTFAHGGEVFDDGNISYSLNSEGAVSALTFLQELVNQGCAVITAERFDDQTDFSHGSSLFTVSSSAGLPFYQSAVRENISFNWSVASLPHTSIDPVQVIYGASLSIPKGTPETELAVWLFIKYLVSSEVQAQWVQASTYLPVRNSVAGGLVDYFTANPAYAASFELLPYATSEPSVPGYNLVSNMIEEAMAAILTGEDVQDILNQLNQDANLNLVERQE